MGDPQNGWFTMETTIEMDELRGTPILGNLHMVLLNHQSKLLA